MAAVARLVAARKAAIDRGDKALGRELYHQLVGLGIDPAAVDADTVTDPADVAPVENADAPAPTEKAVKRIRADSPPKGR